jgi:hypothetical protein
MGSHVKLRTDLLLFNKDCFLVELYHCTNIGMVDFLQVRVAVIILTA